jgi:hypothetical protein
MLYVKRDDEGNIESVHKDPGPGLQEALSEDNPEVKYFMLDDTARMYAKDRLRATDLGVTRVLEDLIQLLIDKNLIMFTDLPESAQQKIEARQAMRQDLQGLAQIIDYED